MSQTPNNSQEGGVELVGEKSLYLAPWVSLHVSSHTCKNGVYTFQDFMIKLDTTCHGNISKYGFSKVQSILRKRHAMHIYIYIYIYIYIIYLIDRLKPELKKKNTIKTQK